MARTSTLVWSAETSETSLGCVMEEEERRSMRVSREESWDWSWESEEEDEEEDEEEEEEDEDCC